MNIKSWLKSLTPAEKTLIAKRAGTSVAYLWQLAGGHSKAGWRLCVKLEEVTQLYTPAKVISKEILRPDIYVCGDTIHHSD